MGHFEKGESVMVISPADCVRNRCRRAVFWQGGKTNCFGEALALTPWATKREDPPKGAPWRFGISRDQTTETGIEVNMVLLAETNSGQASKVWTERRWNLPQARRLNSIGVGEALE